ncbi:hypothetical protein CPLU01_05771 [Colletotrichum plurivorum]|uniref:Zn(2)-C6 fungal-type domain-containing protein n=1 Tax=Colletotrichum plurivorum TaxID=2175906 RepID=A0A8H6KKB7_9PEZI|nr:hypothetical protein CPLU01_05771 [Colletotrichum plurivorum]
MLRPLARSSGGCWTCRIRHRKCDESSPACKECTDRHIQCYGYGPEPDWVKDPAKLQAELHRIKHAVKQNFRQTRKRQAANSPRRILNASTGSSETASLSIPAADSEFREAELLMYYLDYIFPLQYAYYVDKPATGGRGWLFWLLSKRGPLRHAAFTLSALHQHSSSRNKTEEMESELVRYHTNAMQELRHVLGHCETDGFARHPEHRVEFLTCGTFLISFEVFQGGTSKWEPHLNALISVASQVDAENIAGLPSQSLRPEMGFQIMIAAAMRFQMAQLLWFDLVSCVATGMKPKLPYQHWLKLDELDLSSVMGCQNWAMLALGDVALLESELGKTDLATLTGRISAILSRLDEGIRYLDEIQRELKTPSLCQSVTRVYATTVLSQLRAFSATPKTFANEVGESITEVIRSLQNVPDWVSLRGVTWPLAVAGSLARPDQQPYFEGLLEKILDTSGTGFTNCGTVLHILRESWKHQDPEGHDINPARSAMKRLGIRALLV